MASIGFRNLLKTVCFDCETILFWRNLRKAVCFGRNVFFFLGTAGENSRFCQNSLTKREKRSLIFSRYNPFPSWPSAAQDTYFYY